MSDVRPTWIAFGWFLGAALTALALLAMNALGLLADDPTAAEGTWIAAAVAIGFAVAGLMAGPRAAAPPLLFGLGVALISLLVWFAMNLVLGEATDQTAWSEIGARPAAALLLLQAAAAMLGARIGLRWMRSRTDAAEP